MQYPDQEILDAATQEYKIDNQYQFDPVGIQCTRLEGNFLNILWRKTFYRNINKCFDNAGIAIAEMYLSPLALADAVLTDAERRGGSVLVDLGADTTTVCVYYKNILRHLAVIPLGSNNITKDIASLQMEEKSAEQMKLQYASAYTDTNELDADKTYPIDGDRSVEMRKFVDIVEGRVQEIIENVWCQVPSEFYDKLIGGIILTGGASNLKNIDRAFRNHTHVEKIRIAKFVSQTINSNNPVITAKDGTMCTILGLLAKGDMNCAGEEISNNLFGTEKPTPITAEPPKEPRPLSEITGKGIVQTEAEKAADEEARRKKQIEDEARRKAEEAEEERRRLEKRQNSWLHKTINSLKNFGKKIVEDDE
jgi:cell division protein FtsA